jgi:DHA2 family multidrug resistance protein
LAHDNDWRIGERVTIYDLPTQARLTAEQQNFMARGADPVTALREAIGALKQIVRREANIMTYNDAFLLVGISLALGALLVWICNRPKMGKQAAAH